MTPEIQITCDGSSLGNGQTVETRAACAALMTDSVHWRAVGLCLGSRRTSKPKSWLPRTRSKRCAFLPSSRSGRIRLTSSAL